MSSNISVFTCEWLGCEFQSEELCEELIDRHGPIPITIEVRRHRTQLAGTQLLYCKRTDIRGA